MTVFSTEVEHIIDGDGVSDTFVYPFRLDALAHLKCQIIGFDGTRRTPVYIAERTEGAGGSVTLTTEVPSPSERVALFRETTLVQDVNYEAGNFPSSVHERSADRLVMIAQERQAVDMRTLRLPPGEGPLPPIEGVELGRTIIRTATGFGPGPSVEDVGAAEDAAIAAAAAAVVAAGEALRAENARGDLTKYADNIKMPEDFASTAERTDYFESLAQDGVMLYAPIYHPAGTLKISRFLTEYGAYEDQTDALQAAVNELLTSPGLRVLDLEGRLITISRPIVMDEDLVGAAFASGRTIANGMIHCHAVNWQGAADGSSPAFHMTSSSRSNRIERYKFWRVDIRCNEVASGIRIDYQYANIRIVGCDIYDPRGFGIKTDPGYGSGGLLVMACQINSLSQANTPMATRFGIGIDLGDNNDDKIQGNTINYLKKGIVTRAGSHIIIGNHIFIGNETNPGPGNGYTDFNPLIEMGHRSNSVIMGNYFDNGFILFVDDSGAAVQYQGYATIQHNIFTMKHNAASMFFIGFASQYPGFTISNLIVKENQFRGFDSDGMDAPFKKQAGSATPDVNTANNVQIYDNFFWGNIAPQSSRPDVYITLDGVSTSYDIDWTGMTPFELSPNNCRSIGYRSGATSATKDYYYQRISGRTGRLVIGAADNGIVHLEADVNVSSQFQAAIV